MLQEDRSSARYYANPAEQNILISGLRRYFSLPERSKDRNRIAYEVTQCLRYFSPHWSHRAVRLWFNNNKHTYLPQAVPPPAPRPPPQPPMPPSAPDFHALAPLSFWTTSAPPPPNPPGADVASLLASIREPRDGNQQSPGNLKQCDQAHTSLSFRHP
jgi:hypothetical protein